MDRWQILGLGFAVASAGIGTIGLLNTKPLSLSARLGAMASLDTNGDGRLSFREWVSSGGTEETMLALDVNGDGYLDPDEVESLPAPRDGDK